MELRMDADAFSTFTVVSASFHVFVIRDKRRIDRQAVTLVNPQAGVRPRIRILLAAASVADGGDPPESLAAMDVNTPQVAGAESSTASKIIGSVGVPVAFN